MHAITGTGKSEDNLGEPVLFYLQVRGSNIIRFASRHLYPMTSSLVLFCYS